MASVVEICNGALNQLGASTILTLTERLDWYRTARGNSESILMGASGFDPVVNGLRTDLIQEIDESLNEMASTGKLQKLYKQGSTKMYGK